MEKRTILILVVMFVVVICGVLIILTGLGGGLYFLSQRRAQNFVLPTAENAIVSPTDIPTLQPESTTPPYLSPSSAPETTVEPEPNVDFNGIRFYLSPELAQGVLPELISAAEGDAAQTMPGEIHPEYTQFTLQGYILTNTFHDPRIYVYPLPDYRSLDSAVDDVASRLAELIEKQPEQVDTLPFLPLWNAAQQFHAQLDYIEFKNGAGIRFLTQYAQYYAPINNTDLFYTFQGISQDGEWYIALVLPVSHPTLLSTAEEGGGEPSDPVTYYQQISEQISGLDEQSFIPSLFLLDELVVSLRVK